MHAPAWVRDWSQQGSESVPVRLHVALSETRGDRRRLAMVVEHLEALGDWTHLAEGLLDDDSPEAPMRREMGSALVVFAAEAVVAVSPDGPAASLGPLLREAVLEAVAEATLVAGGCLNRAG